MAQGLILSYWAAVYNSHSFWGRNLVLDLLYIGKDTLLGVEQHSLVHVVNSRSKSDLVVFSVMDSVEELDEDVAEEMQVFKAILAYIKISNLAFTGALLGLDVIELSFEPVVRRNHITDSIDNVGQLSRLHEFILGAGDLSTVLVIKLLVMFLRESQQGGTRVRSD